MYTPSVVQRFLQQQNLRSYRRSLSQAVRQMPLVRLQPKLLDLSLSLRSTTRSFTGLEEAFGAASRVTISGISGSGRRLALWQYAVRWAWSDQLGPRPLLLHLPEIDQIMADPVSLVAQQITALGPSGLGVSQNDVRDLAPWSGLSEWTLLVSGWEELPPHRQLLWRSALRDSHGPWMGARIAVVIPDDETRWTGYSELQRPTPTTNELADWVAILAEPAYRPAIQAAISPGAPLAILAEKLLDIAMLCWSVPRSGIPTTRLALYQQGISSWHQQLPQSSPEQIHPLVRAFLSAIRLTNDPESVQLHAMPVTERTEVARFAAALLDDPAPLLEDLLADPEDLQAGIMAGLALRDRGSADPVWVLAIAERLTTRAQYGSNAASQQASQLLQQLAACIDTALQQLGSDPAYSNRILSLQANACAAITTDRVLTLLHRWPKDLPLAWALTARLTNQLTDLQLAGLQAWLDETPAAQARAASLLACGTAGSRWLLATEAGRRALTQFAGSVAEPQLKLRAAEALLTQTDLPVGTRLMALALLPAAETDQSACLLSLAASDPDAALRTPALQLLAVRNPAHLRQVLLRQVQRHDAAPELRYQAMQLLTAQAQHLTAETIRGCVQNVTLPFAARLVALQALDEPALLDILHDSSQPAELRAAVVDRLSVVGKRAGRFDMLILLNDTTTPDVVLIAICEALSKSGERALVTPLLALLNQGNSNIQLWLVGITALGRLQATESISLLREFACGSAFSRLQQIAGPYDLQEAAGDVLARGLLPTPLAERLRYALAGNRLVADPPTTLGEFLTRENDALQAGAAAALAAIGSGSALAALESALRRDYSPATNGIVAACANLSEPTRSSLLAEMLVDSSINAMTRYALIQALQKLPDGGEPLRRILNTALLDPFVASAIVEALGQRRESAALPILSQLVTDSQTDPYLRTQALEALGKIDRPETEELLLRLWNSPGESDELRGAAAANLPSDLSSHGRRLLRRSLHEERLPETIICGSIRALGRASDHESLPQLLRYCQDERLSVAMTAMRALAEIGDPTVTPILVRVTQHAHTERAARLQAIGALLKLEGARHQPLLRQYLTSEPLPLRLQALEHVIDAGAPREDLLQMLAELAWPVPLRLRLLSLAREAPEAVAALRSLLSNPQEDPDLRAMAAAQLGIWRDDESGELLAELACAPNTAIGLRLRCLEALALLANSTSVLALSRIYDDPSQPLMTRAISASRLRTLAIITTNGTEQQGENAL